MMETIQSFNVTGKSVNDLLSLDSETFSHLSEKALRGIVTRIASAGNKRLRRFEKAGESSPATRYIMQKSGGKFSSRKATLDDLRKEYGRIKGFYESETSDLKSWRKVKQETIESLQENDNITITEEQFNDFWEIYDDLSELDEDVKYGSFKYEVLKEIENSMQEPNPFMDSEDVALKLYDRIEKMKDNLLKKKQQEQNDYGVSGFFTV